LYNNIYFYFIYFTTENNEDKLKLYDFTSLHSKSLKEKCCDGQNPFTEPLAMLIYRTAYNLRYNSNHGKLTNLATIQTLLNKCLELLDKTKYPHVINNGYYIIY